MLNGTFNKKIALSVFGISFILAMAYFSYSFLQIKNSRFYNVELNLPQTSQGEIAELYRKSPFKSLRISFAAQEHFTQASFSISTGRNEELQTVKEKVFEYLMTYYKHRKPYPTFQEAEILKIEKLKNEIANAQNELIAARATFDVLKKKYPAYQTTSFIVAEERIIAKELALQALQFELNETMKIESINNLKLLAASESNRSPLSISILIKTILIFISAALLLFAVIHNRRSLSLL